MNYLPEPGKLDVGLVGFNTSSRDIYRSIFAHALAKTYNAKMLALLYEADKYPNLNIKMGTVDKLMKQLSENGIIVFNNKSNPSDQIRFIEESYTTDIGEKQRWNTAKNILQSESHQLSDLRKFLMRIRLKNPFLTPQESQNLDLYFRGHMEKTKQVREKKLHDELSQVRMRGRTKIVYWGSSNNISEERTNFLQREKIPFVEKNTRGMFQYLVNTIRAQNL